MTAQNLKLIAFDTETDVTRSGLKAPPMVCLSWANTDGAHLLDHVSARAWFERKIRDPKVLWIGANISYDMAVMANECPSTIRPIFRAYAEGRVSDVSLRQSLIENAHGKFMGFSKGLADLEKLYGLGDRSAQKAGIGEDVWRLRYAELKEVPLEDWPEAARAYAIADAEGTLRVWLAQGRLSLNVMRAGRAGRRSEIRHAVIERGMVLNEQEQARAAFSLQLMSCWGIMVDQNRLTALTDDFENQMRRLGAKLLDAGLLKDEGGDLKTDGTALFERVISHITKDVTDQERATYEAELETRRAAHWEEQLLKAAERDNERAEAKAAGTKMPAIVRPKTMSETARQQAVVAAWTAAGVVLPTTKTGRLTTGQDVLEVITDEDIEQLVAYDGLKKKLSTFVAPLRDAGQNPLTPFLNPLVESGRASSTNPNIMNLPRAGGERECLVARPGHYLVSTDYSTVELRAWAQVCLDAGIASTMAEALIAGRDLHAQLGAVMAGVSYETFMEWLEGKHGPEYKKLAKKLRGVAKPANFGLPVGMGVTSFKNSSRKSYGIDFDKDPTLLPPEQVIDSWKATWTEAPAYHGWIADSMVETGQMKEIMVTRHDGTMKMVERPDKRGTVVHPRSGRSRGGCGFTEAANTYFQGMAADAFKAALFALSAECYAVPHSPLYGARLLAPIHDEVIMEVAEDRVQAATNRMIEVMENCASRYIPDIPIIAEPAIMRRWSKAAESTKALDGTWTIVENG